MILKKKGFSLVEVILTLLILGILSAVILPRFGGQGLLGNFALKTTSSQISSDMRFTRQLAITNSVNYLIQFDFAQKEYRIYKETIAPENQVQDPRKIPTDVSCSGTGEFTFSPLGSALFSGNGLVLSSGGKQYRITVEPPTGAVVIEKIS